MLQSRSYAKGKDVRFAEDARSRMLEGVKKLADAVAVTLGPKVSAISASGINFIFLNNDRIQNYFRRNTFHDFGMVKYYILSLTIIFSNGGWLHRSRLDFKLIGCIFRVAT